MQTQDIQPALEQMVRDLTDLGAVRPKAYFCVNSDGRFDIHLGVRYKSTFFGSEDYIVFSGYTLEEALSAARAYIAEIPDPRTAKRRQWQKKLGEVIDEGYELELPGDVMEPLREGSLAMPEEDQS